VATFNIRHGERTDGRGVDTTALGVACAALDVEVLALQEVDRGLTRSGGADLTTVVAAATGTHAAFGPALRVRGGEYGNALLARTALSDVEVLPLPGRRDDEPRAAVIAWTGAVTVASAHLGLDRTVSGQQLDTVLTALKARPAPRLLLGDFNRPPALVIPRAEALGYTVADSGPTFPATDPHRRIDYAIVDGLTVVRTEVVATGMSDHCALVVELSAP
jgi:endonuclease/exonuclease/phosphatase family metal-dependent hydrolase